MVVKKPFMIGLFVSLTLILCLGVLQAQTTMTNDSVIRMAGAGLSEDIILAAVNGQAGNYSTGVDDLIALKKAGVTDKVISAMVGKKNSGGAAPSSPAVAPAPDSTASLDMGVYFKKKDEWVEVTPEVITWKTGGFLKGVATAGLVKGDVNGNIKGAESKNRVTTPLEFMIKTAEGVSVAEYQLIRLRQNKSDREFRTMTGGVVHASGGATRDALEFESKKVSSRTFSIALPNNLGPGEYGFLPPGATGSSSAASIGKMYTFRIVE